MDFYDQMTGSERDRHTTSPHGHDSCVCASHTGFLLQLIQTRAAQWSRHKARQSQPYSARTNEELKPQQNWPVRHYLHLFAYWHDAPSTPLSCPAGRNTSSVCLSTNTKVIPSLISPPILKLLKRPTLSTHLSSPQIAAAVSWSKQKFSIYHFFIYNIMWTEYRDS